MKLKSNEKEALHRAEATAILISLGYRVYRPEADVAGEDLLVRTTKGETISVQLKSRPVVHKARYGNNKIWMLFPDPNGPVPGRSWFLIEHDHFFAWVKKKHGSASGWEDAWSYPSISKALQNFLTPFVLK